MADYDPNSTASNYSIQPGSNHPPIASPIDPSDHPADNMPEMRWNEPLDYFHKSANSMMKDRKAGK